MNNLTHKQCARCLFLVPVTRHGCQVCGHNKWSKIQTIAGENISSRHYNDSSKMSFMEYLGNFIWSGTLNEGKQVNIKKSFDKSGQMTNNHQDNHRITRVLKDQSKQTEVLANSNAAIFNFDITVEAISDKSNSEQEVLALKKELEELCQWFKTYGNEGLLTSRTN